MHMHAHACMHLGLPMYVGQHQLECAQLSIKVRDLSQKLEAVESSKVDLVEEHQTQLQELSRREEAALAKQAELEKLSKKQGREFKQMEKK